MIEIPALALLAAFAVDPAPGPGHRIAMQIRTSILSGNWEWLASSDSDTYRTVFSKLILWSDASSTFDMFEVRCGVLTRMLEACGERPVLGKLITGHLFWRGQAILDPTLGLFSDPPLLELWRSLENLTYDEILGFDVDTGRILSEKGMIHSAEDLMRSYPAGHQRRLLRIPEDELSSRERIARDRLLTALRQGTYLEAREAAYAYLHAPDHAYFLAEHVYKVKQIHADLCAVVHFEELLARTRT